MMHRSLAAGVLALLALWAVPGAAEARTSFHVGVGVGVPCCGPAYYYPPPYYYYPPPPVVYVPPPVVYSPAPAGYAPPPPSNAGLPTDAVTLREGRDSNGNYCREYQSTSIVNGQSVPVYGTACLRPDGRWQIVN